MGVIREWNCEKCGTQITLTASDLVTHPIRCSCGADISDQVYEAAKTALARHPRLSDKQKAVLEQI